jgi:hypothetical protein
MKVIGWFLTIFLAVAGSLAQPAETTKKLAETEKAFAAMAEAKGTRAAFLEFLAKDGLIFPKGLPVNAHEFWENRAENGSLLSWGPDFVDVATSGIIGYTAGPWEYRPKGKADAPAAFGHFVTIWQKQPSGQFRAVLDIGISHDKVALSSDWASPADSGKEMNEKRISAADASVKFFETAEAQGLAKAYKLFAAGDVRLYREGQLPFIGKKTIGGAIKKDNNKLQFNRRSVFVSTSDMAYISNGYSYFAPDKKTVVENGSFLQIWKLRKGKWEIVLDIFSPVPAK